MSKRPHSSRSGDRGARKRPRLSSPDDDSEDEKKEHDDDVMGWLGPDLMHVVMQYVDRPERMVEATPDPSRMRTLMQQDVRDAQTSDHTLAQSLRQFRAAAALAHIHAVEEQCGRECTESGSYPLFFEDRDECPEGFASCEAATADEDDEKRDRPGVCCDFVPDGDVSRTARVLRHVPDAWLLRVLQHRTFGYWPISSAGFAQRWVFYEYVRRRAGFEPNHRAFDNLRNVLVRHNHPADDEDELGSVSLVWRMDRTRRGFEEAVDRVAKHGFHSLATYVLLASMYARNGPEGGDGFAWLRMIASRLEQIRDALYPAYLEAKTEQQKQHKLRNFLFRSKVLDRYNNVVYDIDRMNEYIAYLLLENRTNEWAKAGLR